MAAILRAGVPSTQTPVRPGKTVAAMAEATQEPDQRLLECTQVAVEVAVRGSGEIHDRVAHELPGGMVGHITTTLRATDGDAAPQQLVVRRKNVLQPTRASPGNGRRMFKQPKNIGDFPTETACGQLTL